MSSSPTPGDELAAFDHRPLNLRERNWTRWAYGEKSKLYVVFPELPDEDFELSLSFAERLYGADNVVVSSVFDTERRQIDEENPGAGIYVTGEGLAYAEQRWLHGNVALAMRDLGDRLDVVENLMRRHGPTKE
jgi:hypothetical protein